MASRRMRLFPVVGVAGVALGLLIAVVLVPGPAIGRGPLEPLPIVNSFGVHAVDGSTVSLVVELRGGEAATATLRGVSLADADTGLTLVDSGLLVDGYPGTYLGRSFPLGRLGPINGAVVSISPDDSATDVFLNLGIRTTFGHSPLHARGVWLDYDVGTVSYRAFLPWLLTACDTPESVVCPAQPANEFSFPA